MAILSHWFDHTRNKTSVHSSKTDALSTQSSDQLIVKKFGQREIAATNLISNRVVRPLLYFVLANFRSFW